MKPNYLGLEIHVVQHSNLISELNLMISRVSSKKALPEELLEFLNDWLVSHIGKEDQVATRHIEKSIRRPIGENLYSDYLF
jgi:hemerythrin